MMQRSSLGWVWDFCYESVDNGEPENIRAITLPISVSVVEHMCVITNEDFSLRGIQDFSLLRLFDITSNEVGR